MLALQDASKPFPLQAEVSAGSTRAAVVGTLTDPLNLGALDLRLKLSGTSMANLYPLTGITLPDTRPTPPTDTCWRGSRRRAAHCSATRTSTARSAPATCTAA